MPAKPNITPARLGVKISRSVPTRLYPFERYFRGFDRLPPVRALFGARARRVLRSLRVEFFSARYGYMSTSDVDGHLIISRPYLETGELSTVYLDIIHELCHVRQFRAKRPLFYPKLSYVDAPSEIEAYLVTIAEGRRIGLTDAELIEYLRIEWISEAEHRRLVRRMGLTWPPRRLRRKGARSAER